MAGGTDSLTPGELVAGKFRVERTLGRGGMGIVVEAMNVQLGQRVALKFLAAGTVTPETTARFTKEAKAAAKLRGEHVARVYDVGTDPDRGPFIVMELLVGTNLADVLAKTGRLPLQRAAEYVIDACEGLSEAHARGLVHQDIKPANLFVTTSNDGKPSVKVVDFGIARTTTAANEKEQGPSHGSPHYLSPEQLRTSPSIDRRADIWALGCVLHELITGEKAFRATRFVELVANILEGKRAPLPAGLDLPPALAAVIAQCLELEPTRRFQSSGSLAVALLPFARRRAHAVARIAVTRVREAGIDPKLEMPPSLPPPGPDPESSDPIIELTSSGKLPRAAPVPEIFVPGASSPLTTATPIDSASSLPPAARSTAAPAEPRPSRPVLFVIPIGLVLAAAIVGVVMWQRTSSGPVTAAAPPTASPSPSPSPSASPSPAPSPSQSATAADVPTPASAAHVASADVAASASAVPASSALAGAQRPVHATFDAGAARSTSAPKGSNVSVPTGMDIERNR